MFVNDFAGQLDTLDAAIINVLSTTTINSLNKYKNIIIIIIISH